MTPLELEQCILLAYSDVTGEKHWQATRALAEYQAEAATLLPLLQTTTHETVLFFCLTSCFKLQNSTFTEKTQLWHLVLHISSEAPHVRTKAAVVLAYLLQYAFQPCDWNTTFQELQQEAPPDLYFKTLIALAEDCDFDSCGIKDVMRGYHNTTTTIQEQPTIVAQLMDTLLRHVSQHDKDETILTLAFFVLRDFASWVDVTLLIQDQVMMLVFSSLSSSSAGVAAVQFLRELVSRGMNDERKLELLQQVDVLHKLHVHVNLKTVDANPIEVVIEVAKLIDVTGQELISIRMDTASLDSEYTAKLQKLWLQVMELFFRCLAFDDIDVSGAVLPLASRIVITLQNDDMPALQLLNIVHAQMKYPNDYQFDYQNDDEAEEEVYRAELRKLYQKLVRACPDFCLQFLCQVLANLSVPLSTCPTRDIEAALRLVHHYCEGIRPPPGLKTVMKQPTFCAVLTALHQSDVVDHPHREVLLLYYDLSVRYYPIFIKEPQLLPKLLGGLSGERGLLHAHPRVKSRSCYLLLRLVKSVIKVMRPYVETAVTGIQGEWVEPGNA
jgi:exportin-T